MATPLDQFVFLSRTLKPTGKVRYMGEAEHRNRARTHLQQARDFLEAAEIEFPGLLRPAGSNAILAGIHAKDAIALSVNGATTKAQDHRQAITELRSALPGGDSNNTIHALSELLTAKTDVQYSNKRIEPRRIESLIRRARTLVNHAAEVVGGTP